MFFAILPAKAVPKMILYCVGWDVKLYTHTHCSADLS